MKWFNLITLRRVAKLLKKQADTCKLDGNFVIGLRFSNAYYEIRDIIRLMERREYRGK